MPLYGKCPKCEQLVTRLDASAVDLYVETGKAFHGATFSCPNCQTILGAGIDPLALANDLSVFFKQQPR